MDELIQAMSIPELETFKVSYKDNESITKIIDGYIEVKTREELQVKAKTEFVKAIDKLVAKLPHPEDVHNVYMAWREVEVEDTTQEAEEVELTDLDGNKTTETRYPMCKEYRWVVELNKGFSVGRSNAGQGITTSKRAIVVFKREGTQLVEVGKYPSGAEGCKELGITCVGDNPIRVLSREGYLVERFDGTIGELHQS